jgi:phage gp29-like protein
VFIPAFEMMNKDIARALLMPGLLGMTDDQAQGSLARSQVHFDVFMLVLEDLRASLTRVVNERIIEPLLSFNFGAVPDDERPRFEFNPISKDERTEILAAWSTLVGAKVVTPQDADEEHARKLLEFPERDEADATKRAERQADEQADAAAKKAEALPESAAPPFKKAALNDEQFEALLTYAFKQ